MSTGLELKGNMNPGMFEKHYTILLCGLCVVCSDGCVLYGPGLSNQTLDELYRQVQH